jgi:hypothetical protein
MLPSVTLLSLPYPDGFFDWQAPLLAPAFLHFLFLFLAAMLSLY